MITSEGNNMRKTKRLFAAFLAVCLLAALAIPLTAAEQDTGKRKVVSVVYDTSWSMSQAPIGSKDIFQYTNDKWLYARYALQMLMSLLGEEDTLIISSMSPLEDRGEEYPYIEVDLTANDRDGEVHEKLPDPRSDEEKSDARENSIFFNENMEGTPISSVGAAKNRLVERGLMSSENLQDADPSVEHWLVIFTDGIFGRFVDEDTNFDGKDDYKSYNSQSEIEDAIASYISDYPSLNTIYLGFGNVGNNEVYDLADGSLSEKYKFSSYVADLGKGPDTLAEAMQEIANQLSGRYTLDPASYTVDGNTVTVDLAKFPYSFKSVSVMAQNCGATIDGAYLDGSTLPILQKCTIIPPEGLDDMKTGCSAVIKSNTGDCFPKKELRLTFNAPVESLSLLAEPYISLTHYYEYKGERVDMQFINSNLTEGDEIVVRYEAKDGANGTAFDMKDAFGKVVTKVTYAGNSYECGDKIPLTVGKNEVGVSVSVMDGQYTLYSSEICIIESNPLNFRVMHEGDCPATFTTTGKPVLQSTYLIYKEGNPITSKAALGMYTVEVEVTDANGNVINRAGIINDDGTVTVRTELPASGYGEYTEWIKVIDPDKLFREHSHTVNYIPAKIYLQSTGDAGFTMTETEIAENYDKVIRFALTTEGGAPMPFDGMEYTLTVNGTKIESPSVEDNILSFTPNSHSEASMDAREHTVELTASLIGHPEIAAEASTAFTVTPSTHEMVNYDSPCKTVERFALDENTAVVYFQLLRDNKPLSESELQARINEGKITVTDKGTFSKNFMLPCGKTYKAETVNGEGVIAVRVTRDWINPFQSFEAMFILNGAKPVTATYGDTAATDAFTFTPSSLWSYIWRILVILLVIHLTLFIIGFFIARSYPTGTFLKISLPTDDSSKIRISSVLMNFSFKDKWLWHYKRLIFMLPIFGDQPGRSLFGMASIKFTKKEKPQYAFLMTLRDLTRAQPTNEGGRDFAAILKEIGSKKFKGVIPRVKDTVTAGILRKMYRPKGPDAKVAGQESNISGTAYGKFDSNQKLKEILVFIKKSR